MASTPEVKVKKRIDAQIERVPYTMRIKPIGGQFSEPGVSDYVLCSSGLFVAIEAKSVEKDPYPTELQKKFLRRTINNQGLVAVVDETNVDGLAAWLTEAVNNPDSPQVYLNREDAIASKIKNISLDSDSGAKKK